MYLLHFITRDKNHGIKPFDSIESAVENGLKIFNEDSGFPVCVTYENYIEVDRVKFISIINKQSENFDNIYHYEVDALSMANAI